MTLIRILFVSIFSFVSSAHAGKVIICLHGMGDGDGGSARVVASKLNIPDESFKQTLTPQGLTIPLGGQPIHVFNPKASDVVGRPSMTWFPSVPQDLQTLTPEHIQAGFQMIQKGLNKTPSNIPEALGIVMEAMGGTYNLQKLSALLMVSPELSGPFHDFLKPDALKVKTYIEGVLKEKGLGTEDLILCGVSQGGIMAHYVATLMDQPIGVLVMAITFPTPGAQFGDHNLPKNIIWANGGADDLFPTSFVDAMKSKQSEAFRQKCEFTSAVGVGHDVTGVSQSLIAGLIKSLGL